MLGRLSRPKTRLSKRTLACKCDYRIIKAVEDDFLEHRIRQRDLDIYVMYFGNSNTE